MRRIVVGLDIAPHSRSALAAAAALAREFGAELEALFVESDELHGLAGLPFARETGFPSASIRRIDPGALERSLQARVREATRALASAGDPRPVRWTLRVARGTVAEQLLAASPGADLAVVGVTRWGPEALRFAGAIAPTLVVLQRAVISRGPVAAICPVEVPPGQVIPFLCSLAPAVGDDLAIVAVARDARSAERWRMEAVAALRALGRRARIELVVDGQVQALEDVLARLAPRAVVHLARRQPRPD